MYRADTYQVVKTVELNSLISLNLRQILNLAIAVINLKGRIDPIIYKKRQSISGSRGGNKYEFILELQSTLKLCYYCDCTDHQITLADYTGTHYGKNTRVV
ncbi:unnamed protein product [Ambrosiozyma monospora]|uniref:Unnamed protein product n=1 Tax=Ambrosiozyma monospora TaxID=43982 RepID=A0A9W7DE67_AMBMO|nr:unnamed protein product [Ambrosiozyma monospora]